MHAGVAVTNRSSVSRGRCRGPAPAPGLGSGGRDREPEPTGFLYPFIEAEETHAGALVRELVESASTKAHDSDQLRAETLDSCGHIIASAGKAMAERFVLGGRLYTFGNGGSATDAQGAAELFRQPPHGRPLPALSLVDDQAVLTALSDDVGFELVFSRQIIAYATAHDMVVGFSTSGDSLNLLRASSRKPRWRGTAHGGPVRVRTLGHGHQPCRAPLPRGALRRACTGFRRRRTP